MTKMTQKEHIATACDLSEWFLSQEINKSDACIVMAYLTASILSDPSSREAVDKFSEMLAVIAGYGQSHD